jgi:hypothetical protein
MENRERVIFRNEKGRFAKKEIEPVVEARKAPEYILTHVTADDRITTVRGELADIQKFLVSSEVETPLVEIKLPELAGNAEMGILGDKVLKRKQKEVKEKSPKQFTEMLVVFNDVQLLKEADQEALGAFLKYIDANKKRITHLVANGDILDFSAQSGFEKDLNTMNSTNDEVEAGRWLIDHLSQALPDAKKVFIWGNHENRWKNLIEAEKGNETWVKTLDEQFGLTENGWEQYGYGSGEFYDWHNQRIFWHGHRSSIHTSKAELQDAGMSVTTGHINRNQYFETTDARGVRSSGIAHGGFSKDSLGFMRKAVTNWSQGFGVYFYDEKTKTETPYMVTMSHKSPRFIGPDGELYDGTGWSIPGFGKSDKNKK